MTTKLADDTPSVDFGIDSDSAYATKFDCVQPSTRYLAICGPDLQPMVKISLADGSIEFGDGYDPDEAARIFWRAVTGNFPQ